MKNSTIISEELLTRYASGNASLEEMAHVAMAMAEDPSLKQLVSILEEMSEEGTLDMKGSLPACDCAGAADDNLCDVLCEKFILQDYLGAETLNFSDASDNIWMKECGTPLHAIGRLLEKFGMSVKRLYDCTAEDIINCLKEKKKAIAVLDSGELWNGESDGIFHAVVCLSLSPGAIAVYDPSMADGKLIKVYDPKVGANVNYDFARFLKAWNYSHNYLVVASHEGLEYQPHPLDIDDIMLNEELVELTESLAEEAHEVWASKRKEEGWTYGELRDDQAKKHPDLIPYSELPESEKDYDRAAAMHTLRVVRKLGFDIHKKYTLYCPECGKFVSEDMRFCPECGKKLDWDFLK